MIMAETNISIPELVKALRRIKTLDELRCMGCGYEHDCSIHGCVIIRQAADVIEVLSELILKQQVAVKNDREEAINVHSERR